MGANWENESTYKPRPAPTPEEIDAWRRDPRNHITPGLQEIPVQRGPTRQHNEISPPPSIRREPSRTPSTKVPVFH